MCHEGIGPNIGLGFAINRARVEKYMPATVFPGLNNIAIGSAVNQARFAS